MSTQGGILLEMRAGLMNNNGDPLSGGKVWTYAAGTSTPQPSYTTNLLNVPNANPVVLDSSGRATIYVSPIGYKLVVTDANDVQLWSQDNVWIAGPPS